MPAPPTSTDIHDVRSARFEQLDRRTLYDILRLRAEVFVVEQDCVFCEPDGRDAEVDAIHLWTADDDGGVAACARLLHEADTTWSVGRIVARPSARSTGAASALVRSALDQLRALGAERVTISAQAQLHDWYRRFGFVVDGARYLEDGILHLPMSLNLTEAPNP